MSSTLRRQHQLCDAPLVRIDLTKDCAHASSHVLLF